MPTQPVIAPAAAFVTTILGLPIRLYLSSYSVPFPTISTRSVAPSRKQVEADRVTPLRSNYAGVCAPEPAKIHHRPRLLQSEYATHSPFHVLTATRRITAHRRRRALGISRALENQRSEYGRPTVRTRGNRIPHSSFPPRQYAPAPAWLPLPRYCELLHRTPVETPTPCTSH